jgi:hypothetical protein
VVFTGPAFDGNGNSIIRADLTHACMKKGNLRVQNRVLGDTDILVASRGDTVKAKGASQRGIAVFTYAEFISRFLQGVELTTGGKANSFVDSVKTAKSYPQFVSGAALAQIDVL